jgi:hypothetical protein
MTDFDDIERLRRITNCQTDLVLREARLAEEAIGRTIAIVEADEYDEDDANAFHVSRGRPTAIILPFPRSGL